LLLTVASVDVSAVALFASAKVRQKKASNKHLPAAGGVLELKGLIVSGF
jgi:hypothetical protein